jgi:hypothetical protein
MNSYNENLRSVVVNSLQGQYLDQKNLKSQMTAAMFTLYHAEGATITADEKLDEATSTLAFVIKVKEQAVKNSNISVNLLSAATKADQYLKQAVNNTAVCAANVQVSAKAIVRLSGDIANIAGITGAADLETDIDELADEIRWLMNETAKIAEVASQFAMEASALTAKVSSPTVFDKSKSTNSLMNNLLKIASSSYDTAAQIVTADNVTLTLASATKKLSEGALEDISVNYQASRDAYQSVSRKLNLNLRVPNASITNASFTLSFDAITIPFTLKEQKEAGESPVITIPTDQYYALMVKDSKQLSFTISEAEKLQLDAEADAALGKPVKRIIQIVQISGQQPKQFTQIVEYAEHLDTDGDPVQQGQKYVIFILAIYSDKYKRSINNYDNFLSASSKPFGVTFLLSPISGIEVTGIGGTEKSPEDIANEEKFENAQVAMSAGPASLINDVKVIKPDYLYRVSFSMYEDSIFKPEYRCMFLPVSAKLISGFLTNSELNDLVNKELSELENVFERIDEAIAKLNIELTKIGHGAMEEKSKEQWLKDILNIFRYDNPSFYRAFKRQLDLLEADEKLKKLDDIVMGLKKQSANKAELIKNSSISATDRGIFFNTTLAEQVTAGNYSIAVPSVLLKSAGKQKKTETDPKQVEIQGLYVAYAGPETTDNFGNLLMDGNSYLPVILSTSLNEVDTPEAYTNAISSLDSKPFIYSVQNLTN